MQGKMSVDEYLEAAAERGLMQTTVRINSKKKLADLCKEDLVVTRRGSQYCSVSWDNAIVNDLPEEWTTDEYFKTHTELTQAQRLWMMAVEASNK